MTIDSIDHKKQAEWGAADRQTHRDTQTDTQTACATRVLPTCEEQQNQSTAHLRAHHAAHNSRGCHPRDRRRTPPQNSLSLKQPANQPSVKLDVRIAQCRTHDRWGPHPPTEAQTFAHHLNQREFTIMMSGSAHTANMGGICLSSIRDTGISGSSRKATLQIYAQLGRLQTSG